MHKPETEERSLHWTLGAAALGLARLAHICRYVDCELATLTSLADNSTLSSNLKNRCLSVE